MQDYAYHCPSFGNGWDLYIAENANVNSPSSENLGHIYTAPSGKRDDSFLTGNRHFRANEVETFYKTV